MIWFVIIFAFLCIVILAGAFFWLLQSRKPSQDPNAFTQIIVDIQKEMGSLKLTMQEQSVNLSRQLNSQLESQSRFLNEAHEGYNRTVGQVQFRLGELQKQTQNLETIGKDISSLQDILKSPKLRGGLGELFLGELLRQILPEDHFALQYTFRNGNKVDAVILLGQSMIPVDAKFPLENFRRIIEIGDESAQKQARKSFIQDVKKHIDQIASKYILPDEGTFDFALMYIPAENVYYETILKEDQVESLSDYALKKRVIAVSPNSFYAYLQAIVRGLRGLRIEQSAKNILESLGQLEADFNRSFEDFEKLGSHLSNAASSYDKTYKRLEKLKDKLASIDQSQKQTVDNNPTSLIES